MGACSRKISSAPRDYGEGIIAGSPPARTTGATTETHTAAENLSADSAPVFQNSRLSNHVDALTSPKHFRLRSVSDLAKLDLAFVV
jgi:hypothetical protein